MGDREPAMSPAGTPDALVQAATPDTGLLAGVDEAGLGPILGPLVVAGVAMAGPRGRDPWALLDRRVCRDKQIAGKLRVAVNGWPAGRSELRRNLRHELTHAFLRELYPHTPTWLHEGLAQIMAGRSVAAATGAFRTGRYKLLPLRTFLGRFTDTKDAAAAGVGYAQSLMLVGYLQKLGNRRIHQLLRQFRRATDSETAVQLIYRMTMDQLLRAATK